ncbi:hypothetical protein C7B76_29650 [filamentous cyanobacterium CCP2]|nr:hypothetical protein C7B76_29650 [filamentous cyanobacterium CCP2]
MKTLMQPCRRWLGRRSFQFIGWSSILWGALATGLAQPTIAAEQLIFTYGPFQRSIPIEDLRTFADTGETTSQLRWYLNFADLEPELLQQVLTTEIPVDVTTIDSITYSLPGQFALFQVGQVVHTRSRRADLQALRGALIVSASDGGRISLLEFLENYPTPGIYIDGVRLARVAQDVNNFIDRVEPIAIAVQEFLGGLICDCSPATGNSQPPEPPAGATSGEQNDSLEDSLQPSE